MSSLAFICYSRHAIYTSIMKIQTYHVPSSIVNNYLFIHFTTVMEFPISIIHHIVARNVTIVLVPLMCSYSNTINSFCGLDIEIGEKPIAIWLCLLCVDDDVCVVINDGRTYISVCYTNLTNYPEKTFMMSQRHDVISNGISKTAKIDVMKQILTIRKSIFQSPPIANQNSNWIKGSITAHAHTIPLIWQNMKEKGWETKKFKQL